MVMFVIVCVVLLIIFGGKGPEDYKNVDYAVTHSNPFRVGNWLLTLVVAVLLLVVGLAVVGEEVALCRDPNNLSCLNPAAGNYQPKPTR